MDNTIFIVKKGAVVHREELKPKNERKAQLVQLAKRYGSKCTFVKADGQWHDVAILWNCSGSDVKTAKMFLTSVKELPQVLQMMMLVGAA